MSESPTQTYRDYTLPSSVVTRVDISRLLREVETIDSLLTTAAVQQKVHANQQSQITASDTLNDFLQENSTTITGNAKSRMQLIAQLRLLKDKAPVVRMTFAVPTDAESASELVNWLRREVHPHALIAIGLQPSLVAGVYVRTPNRVFDLSLRGALRGRREALAADLEAYRVGKR